MSDREPSFASMVLQRMDSQDKVLAEINGHVKETNGRVHALELWKARAEGIKSVFHWLPPVTAGLLAAIVTSLVTISLAVH